MYRGNGFYNTYIGGSPWARVLTIALGGDPNDPSRSSSVTPSSTPSISFSSSISKSISTTKTPTISKSISHTKTASLTPSQTQTQTSTFVVSESSSVLPSTSISQSVSESSSISNSNTPSASTTSAESLIPQAPIPITSIPQSIKVSKSTQPTSEKPTPISTVSSKTSPSIIPSSVDSVNCNKCEFGETQFVIQPESYGSQNDENESIIILQTSEGSNIGSLIIPSNIVGTNTILDVSYVSNFNHLSSNLGNSIIDITLTDELGNNISNLADDLIICFTDNDVDDDTCLSFFNTFTRQWECEDECLQQKDGEYCGKTNHLTSFALLFNGIDGGNDCDNSNYNEVYGWISLGMLIFAIIIISIAVIGNEIRYKMKKRKIHRLLHSLQTMESNGDVKGSWASTSNLPQES